MMLIADPISNPAGVDRRGWILKCQRNAPSASPPGAVLPDLIAKWEPTLGVAIPGWGIRRMKTKWGSCNRQTGRLWFNAELAKKHPECLEYVVVHEMTHLLEGTHGERFVYLMDQFLPDWRPRRDRLNDAPLGAEVWLT